ncbi:zinc finger CCCH domain-containing protein 13-like [Xiphophorus maculatus]|uniref:Zinc finger CCCH domain-containing protein 13-like n=1 Tax=Xiphophorus maculatus TaxID=8083 RepID=A0A3B5Q3X8_XIPMA|nr:zinc finger CCCH domain-containing protein 13-like [Xiphophorus maculatus]
MDKLLPSGKVSRDPSPLSGMRGIFHRGNNNQKQNRRKESETQKMRDKEMVGLERSMDRDRPPHVRDGEKEWRDGERRQADGRDKQCRVLSNVERTQTEPDVKTGTKKGDTFPRERKGDRDPITRKMAEGEMRQRDRPRREQMEDWEMERYMRQDRERVEIQRRVIEEGRSPPEDIRTQKRERYKVSGVEFQDRKVEVDDSWDRRDRDAGRKREQYRAVMDTKDSERCSPQMRPERKMYTERIEKTARKDARNEGDIDARELEKREKMRDKKIEQRTPFSRNEVFYRSRRARGKDRGGNQERYNEERHKRREKDYWDRDRDVRTEMRPADREWETRQMIRSDGSREDDQYRSERRDRERRKRQEDGREGLSNRSLSDSSPRVTPRGQSSGEWRSQGGSDMRYIRESEREQTREGSVGKEPQIDPGQMGEKRQRQIVGGERFDRNESISCGSDKTRMWLGPQRGISQPRQKEGRRIDEKEIKSQEEGERDVWQLQGNPDERNMTQSRERHLEIRGRNEDSEGLSVDGFEEEEVWRDSFSEDKEPLSNSGRVTEGSWRTDIQGENLLNSTSGTEEEGGSCSGSRGGSVNSCNPNRDRMLSLESSKVFLSSGVDNGHEMEQRFRRREKFSEPRNSNKREEDSSAGNEEVINAEQQGRENKLIFCAVGQTVSRSETHEVSLSQDEEGGVEIYDTNIEDHQWRSDEDTHKPQHHPTPSRRNQQLNTPRGESLASGDPSGDGYAAPVDLQDKEVEEIMRKEALPTDMGIKKRDSKTERLLEQWRDKNNRKEDQTSCGDLPHCSTLEQIQPFLNEIATEAMSPEELEVIRLRRSGILMDPERTKRRSDAPHLKWATSIVREILGHSGEQTEDEPNSGAEENQHVKQIVNDEHQEEAERRSVNLPVVTLTTDDQQSEPDLEEDDEDEDNFDFKDDNDFHSQSCGEAELRNALNSVGRRNRKSFYNRPQLYQQYNEESQNIEILRQSRSDTLIVGEGNSRSPLPSPPPARRPLPPLPASLHPHSLSQSICGHANAQTLSLPDRSQSERRASSPSLSFSLTQSSLLWRDLPNVCNNPELEKLTEDQRRLQEVRFEVLTSEASYCRSLDIVVGNFVKNKELEKLLTTQDKNWLFSRLTEVRAISHRFLAKLEERVESDVLHFTVCDIIAQQCRRFRKVYVPYLTNQSYQDATYQRLMNDNPHFKRIVDNLEKSHVCQRLPLRSFLVLPFQRITRIKLLVQNIVKRTTPGTVEAENTIKALKLLERIIQESNDSIAEMKTIESLVSLSGKVEFVDCKTLPLISQKRRLVKEGSITQLMDSLKQAERTIYLHLFNDYLLVSIQKEGGKFTVIDHCPVEELRTEDFRVKILTLQKNSFRLHLSQNSLLLRTETKSDKLRWISALSRSCPVVDFSTAENLAQMQCIRAYIAQQPDEMSVEKADIILVHKDSGDNWIEGIRLSDQHFGWVPNSHLQVISNDKVKKRNLLDALTLTKAKAAV